MFTCSLLQLIHTVNGLTLLTKCNFEISTGAMQLNLGLSKMGTSVRAFDIHKKSIKYQKYFQICKIVKNSCVA